ncbi:MAG TPA: ATP-binding protein, partial [Desulfopila sp.]|nr:ATP-binding protein [Desulfopila sp.]
MTNVHPFQKTSWLFTAGAIGVLSVILLAAFYFSYHINKESVVDKLTVVAELSAEKIRLPLTKEDIGAIEREVAAISQHYKLDGVELYGSDGSRLVEYGRQVAQPPTSMMLGENLSIRWPFLLMVQFSRIVFHEDRPLGLLILYQAMSANAVAAGCVVVLLFLLLFLWIATKTRPGGNGTPLSNDAVTITGKREIFKVDDEVQRLVLLKTADLERQRDKALQSAQAKGDFLANMSHEIRTTMNGVVGVLSLLQESNFSEEKKRLLDVAVRSADSLLLVINDILDFSKIESGRMDFERITFDLREIVEECVFLYIDTARSKGIRLHCYLPLEISTSVIGDPTRLRQIITNLLSNALKFTDNGQVSFRVDLVDAEPHMQKLRFAVEDTGIGIKEQKLEGLFEMFTQAETTTTRKYGGTGLGLNVCKKLVELQGGEIGVNSSVGQGTTFWFTLSFERAADNLAPRALVEKKIALFDNCETCSTIIIQYLRGSALQSRLASDSDDILHQLQQFVEEGYVPEILLVDYNAVADEIDRFIEEVARLFGRRRPELFVLTRQGGIEEKLQGTGVAGIILKPVRLIQLHEYILGVPPQVEIDLSTKVEVDGARILLVDDEHINRYVGQMILESIGFDVDIAADGDEALQKTLENRYDALLMDIQMPGVDGLETTRIIRRRERRQGGGVHLPILAMTANALPAMKDRCLAIGMDGFITKPIKPETLLQHLRTYLDDAVG